MYQPPDAGGREPPQPIRVSDQFVVARECHGPRIVPVHDRDHFLALDGVEAQFHEQAPRDASAFGLVQALQCRIGHARPEGRQLLVFGNRLPPHVVEDHGGEHDALVRVGVLREQPPGLRVGDERVDVVAARGEEGERPPVQLAPGLVDHGDGIATCADQIATSTVSPCSGTRARQPSSSPIRCRRRSAASGSPCTT